MIFVEERVELYRLVPQGAAVKRADEDISDQL